MVSRSFFRWAVRRIVLVAGGLIIGVVAAELLARIVPCNVRYDFDRRLYDHDRHIIQFMYGEGDEDPLIGFHNIPYAQGTFTNKEFSTHLRFNFLGFRGPAVSLQTDPKKRRLLVLGDSMALGWGVEEEDTFIARINRARPDWEALNLGVSGFGTRQEWGFLKRYGPMLHPRDVVVIFYPNDPSDSAAPPWKFYPWKAPPMRLQERLYLPEFWKAFRRRHAPPYYYWRWVTGHAAEASETYFRLMKNWCQKNHVAFHVVYMPYRDELGEPTPVGYRKEMTVFWEKEKIDFIDLTPTIQHLKDPYLAYYHLDEHLTPFGHAVVAEALLHYLKDKPL